MAFNKKDETLLAAVDQILGAMHEDGTLARLSVKWLNTDITSK